MKKKQKKKNKRRIKFLKNKKTKLLVGLGNPGRKYIDTRHNVGFKVVELFTKEYNIEFNSELKGLIEIAKINVYNKLVFVAKPLTFMNVSGDAVSKVMQQKEIDLDDLLVVYDDVDLKVGNIKVKPFGGSAGHKGIKSIIKTLKTEKFKRIRIGIGHPGKDRSVSDYVLNIPNGEEENVCLKQSIEKAKKAVEYWLQYGIEKTMSKFN